MSEKWETVDAATGRLLREGEDYYCEGSALVFMAQYHLDRGECCGSGCRHCPWGNGGGNGAAPDL